MRTRFLLLAIATVVGFSASIAHGEDAAGPLRAYNVDPAQVSVSGHQFGAEMAMQIGIAYSSRIMGVGIFAPALAYDCRRTGNNHLWSSECNLRFSESVAQLEATIRGWSGREIDQVEYLKGQRIYSFVGAYANSKTSYAPKVVKLYERFVAAGNVRTEETFDVKENTLPTDFDHPSFSDLNCLDNPPLANCGFDGAGAALEWIYGPLNPRGTGFGDGALLTVYQSEFATHAQGFDDVGYLYVPASCAGGATCRLHVFLHACNQSNATRGDLLFPRYSGHIRWAETNRMIVLFPQTYPDPYINPEGCWDATGRYDVQFNQKGGIQTSALMAMVARITSGYRPSQAIEYHHAEFGHYFVTAEQDEIAKLDAGTSAGWARTGEQFAVQALGASGTVNVCRFFGRFGVKSSHFYALEGVDCDKAKLNPDWEFEGLRFAVYPPDAAGSCAPPMKPLFRLYNNGQGGAPNHRYTTSTVTRGQMLALGWVQEGAGDGVVACATQ